MLLWFTFGLGLYLGLVLKDPMPMKKAFLKANFKSLLIGLLLGLVLWPVGLFVQTVWAIEKIKSKK